jgi:molybdopterin synthase sulfur carrier subunit
MKLVYFAWVRERIGKPEEEIELPAAVATISDLIAYLKTRGEEYANALREPKAIRTAIDHVHAQPETRIAGAREIALFPPMTGG